MQNKIENLQQNLDYINKKSKNFYWYIRNKELFELDKSREKITCCCNLDSVEKSFLTEDDEENNKLILRSKDDFNDIVLDAAYGGYC